VTERFLPFCWLWFMTGGGCRIENSGPSASGKSLNQKLGMRVEVAARRECTSGTGIKRVGAQPKGSLSAMPGTLHAARTRPGRTRSPVGGNDVDCGNDACFPDPRSRSFGSQMFRTGTIVVRVDNSEAIEISRKMRRKVFSWRLSAPIVLGFERQCFTPMLYFPAYA